MRFYRWMMNRGAGILFLASLIIFFISSASSFRMQGSFADGEPLSERLMFLLAAASALTTAISNSALTFFGACFLYRFDVTWGSGRK
jgi:hypothetical protein